MSDTPTTDAELGRLYSLGYSHPSLHDFCRKMERTLRGLANAVGSMRVPQTVEDAALQVRVTIGPAFTAARTLLGDPVSALPPCDHDECGLTECTKEMPSDFSAPVYGIMDPDYARFYSIARCTAKMDGYALALHGSFTRDLDVTAIPWIAKPKKAEEFVQHTAFRTGTTIHNPMTLKEHGRMSWTLHFPEFGDPRFIDFSVMPVQAEVNQISQLANLSRQLIKVSTEPDCGCEFQHGQQCAAVEYGKAVQALESFIGDLHLEK